MREGEEFYTQAREEVELRPTFKEVAVAVPHFSDVNTGRRVVSKYESDTYYRGYELTTGTIDAHTLRTDPRFADDPRLILYAMTRSSIHRFDLNNLQLTRLWFANNKREVYGQIFADSLDFGIGGDIMLAYQLAKAAPVTTPDFAVARTIDSVLVRTSQQLNEQQVAQFKEKGLVNKTAKYFGYPQATNR